MITLNSEFRRRRRTGSLRGLSVLGLVLGGVGAGSVQGAVTVNDPSPVTHEVFIQPIVTRKLDGTTATFLGSATSEAYIKGEIDRVWAQSGLRITWLPEAIYVSDWAYDGWPQDYSSSTRPQSHLGSMVSQAGSPPKSPNATVLNMFFVEIVPGFSQVSNNTANGLAFLDDNGSAVHVGSNLTGWTAGRDVIASVIAHEIGHNLGLSHVSSGSPNLMSPGGSTEQLTASQTNTVFTNHSGIDGYDFLAALPEESNYTQWATLFGVEGQPEDDFDGDRICNLIEFMLGLDGAQPDLLPGMTADASGLTWTLPKNAAALDDGLVYAVEVSEDGSNWYPAGTSGVPSTVLVDNATELTVRLPAGEPRLFMRFAAEVPAGLAAAARTFVPLEAAEELNAGRERVYSDCGHQSCGCRSAHRK